MSDDRCPYCQTPYKGDLDENGKLFCECDGSRVAELQAEIERLREAQRWIPVGERLPEEKGRYLFQAKSTVSNRYFVSIEYYEPGWGTHPLFTHWKPLPPPQEAEGN